MARNDLALKITNHDVRPIQRQSVTGAARQRRRAPGVADASEIWI